jgi:hypothetical protein
MVAAESFHVGYVRPFDHAVECIFIGAESSGDLC